MMQLVETVTTWKDSLVKLIIQSSYIENGKVYIHFTNDDSHYTESFTLANLKEFRDKTNMIIEHCEAINKGVSNL